MLPVLYKGIDMHYDHLRNEFYNLKFPEQRDHKSVLQYAEKRKNMQEVHTIGLFKLGDVAKFKE